MVKVKKESIDGVTFEVTQLGFADGRKLFVRLAKTFGPGLAVLAEGASSLKDLPLANMVTRAVDNLTDKDLEEVGALLGGVTRYSEDGKKWPFLDADHREALFAGRLALFFQWLWFALKVQYSDFSPALAAPSVPDRAQEPGRSPPDTSNS